MTFAYDLRYASDHFLGIGTYAFGLLDALLRRPELAVSVLWDPTAQQTRFDFAPVRAHPRVQWHERSGSPLDPRSMLATGAWLRAVGARAYVSPFHLLPHAPAVPCVVTVHDVRPLRFRSELPWWRRLPYRMAMTRALRARFVTTVSDFSRRELAALVPGDHARVRTVRPGVQPGLDAVTPAPRAAPGGPFALLVGDSRPHKNHATLAAAWAALGPEPPLELVWAGPADPRHPGLASRFADPATARVRALGRVGEPSWRGSTAMPR